MDSKTFTLEELKKIEEVLLLLLSKVEKEIAERDAEQWRDDDCPQAEKTFGVRP